MKKLWIILCIFALSACSTKQKDFVTLEVNGGQGVAVMNNRMYVNGSKQISIYKGKKKIKQNKNVFPGALGKVNHMGAISAARKALYVPVEYFDGMNSSNLQVAVYDHDLKYQHSFAIQSSSGQKECSAVAVDPDDHTLWLCEWGHEASSTYFYHYDQKGHYLGKIQMKNPVYDIQGICIYHHELYIACDDGDDEKGESDHIYKMKLKDQASLVKVKTLNDVVDQGEVEGLCVNASHLYVLYNRGAKVENGVVKGLKKGYTHQIHEVYIY